MASFFPPARRAKLRELVTPVAKRADPRLTTPAERDDLPTKLDFTPFDILQAERAAHEQRPVTNGVMITEQRAPSIVDSSPLSTSFLGWALIIKRGDGETSAARRRALRAPVTWLAADVLHVADARLLLICCEHQLVVAF